MRPNCGLSGQSYRGTRPPPNLSAMSRSDGGFTSLPAYGRICLTNNASERALRSSLLDETVSTVCVLHGGEVPRMCVAADVHSWRRDPDLFIILMFSVSSPRGRLIMNQIKLQPASRSCLRGQLELSRPIHGTSEPRPVYGRALLVCLCCA